MNTEIQPLVGAWPADVPSVAESPSRTAPRPDRPAAEIEQQFDEVEAMLESASGSNVPNARPKGPHSETDDDANAPLLEDAISDFLQRISGGNGIPERHRETARPAHQPQREPAPVPPPPTTADQGRFQPRTAPESADVLERMRSLSKLTADHALERHALNRLILRARLWLWSSCTGILAVVGLLQVPYGSQPDLSVLTPIACFGAVFSSIAYFVTTGKLRRSIRPSQSP